MQLTPATGYKYALQCANTQEVLYGYKKHGGTLTRVTKRGRLSLTVKRTVRNTGNNRSICTHMTRHGVGKISRKVSAWQHLYTSLGTHTIEWLRPQCSGNSEVRRLVK